VEKVTDAGSDEDAEALPEGAAGDALPGGDGV
jgi:hypothetical protein